MNKCKSYETPVKTFIEAYIQFFNQAAELAIEMVNHCVKSKQ